MTLQIFGTKKCKDTQKAIRFFKERRINFQFIDFAEKAISKGELESIKKDYYLEDIIDTYSKKYEELNLAYIKHDIEEMLLEHPLLFVTPILRSDFGCSVGYFPEEWSDWAKKLK